MKIWIDFINSPQVSFFDPLISDLTKDGHEIILTCRNSANTVDLIKQRNWKFAIIGKNVKKTTVRKLLCFPQRVYQLYSFLKDKKIDAAISQSSFYLPITAKLLNVPSIYTNDNEHAMGNIPAFLFATKIFIPETLSILKVIKWSGLRSKTSNYPGIKEGVYLWPKGTAIQEKRKANELGIKKIYVRPEPSSAQYYSGKINFLDHLLIELNQIYQVIILSREKTQLAHYRQKQFAGIEVPSGTLVFDKIAENCALFIGAGGSMTREMALIGIPTISVYDGDLLEVDKFLIAQELMVHKLALTFEEVKAIITLKKAVPPNLILIDKGKEAYQLFKQEILKFNK